MLVSLALALPSSAQACDRAAQVGGVAINEFLPDPGSDDAGREWVEIVNPTNATVDVSGWVIAAGTSSLGASDPLPDGTRIRAGGYLVVGQDPLLNPDADVYVDGFSLGNASSNSDATRALHGRGTRPLRRPR